MGERPHPLKVVARVYLDSIGFGLAYLLLGLLLGALGLALSHWVLGVSMEVAAITISALVGVVHVLRVAFGRSLVRPALAMALSVALYSMLICFLFATISLMLWALGISWGNEIFRAIALESAFVVILIGAYSLVYVSATRLAYKVLGIPIVPGVFTLGTTPPQISDAIRRVRIS